MLLRDVDYIDIDIDIDAYVRMRCDPAMMVCRSTIAVTEAGVLSPGPPDGEC
ncbi:hypothetical protein ACFXPV_35320 [Streptomyces sp. NPDC059118]|uniref:hypothetical protein n=1 Tax=unclassified Streptomyces TaxID=2593676 RepID=UPI0036CAD835